MPAGYPDWPGPRDADEGASYSRDGPRDCNVFHVQTIDANGRIVVSGVWEEK